MTIDPRWKTLDRNGRLALVVALRREQLTFSAIAEKLGVSRNAIAGLVDRNKSAFADMPRAAAKARAPKPPRVSRPSRAKAPPLQPLEIPPIAPAPVEVMPAGAPPAPAPPEPASDPVAFVLATARHCQWPLWPHRGWVPLAARMVCGAPATAGVYCAHHHDRAYGPRKVPS